MLGLRNRAFGRISELEQLPCGPQQILGDVKSILEVWHNTCQRELHLDSASKSIPDLHWDEIDFYSEEDRKFKVFLYFDLVIK